MVVLIKNSNKQIIQVDDATQIGNYGFLTDVYDMVDSFIDGEHGTMKNKASTKSYYIISGNAKFVVDENEYELSQGDIISILPNSWLKIIGSNLRSIIISNPPFDPKDEEWK